VSLSKNAVIVVILAVAVAGMGLAYKMGQESGSATSGAKVIVAAPKADDLPPSPQQLDAEQPNDRPPSATPLDLSALPTTDWVTIHDPERSWAGYTLLFYERRVPMLVDMNGRLVHAWPSVRAVSRARLTPSGHLLYIAVDDSLVEVDWDGQFVRSFRTGNGKYFPHHDLQWTTDDGLLGIFRAPESPTDNVLAVNSEGELEWTWASDLHLGDDLSGAAFKAQDLTHLNSVQSIPDNPHARAGDTRFKAGNVLISSRHLSTVYLIDRPSGDVVWKYSDNLDWQHEAVLLGDDVPGAGHVMVFNNRYHSENRQSEVLEIDPITNEVVWKYTDERFFSDVAGTGQKLPNGNVLITSSRGGRIFEVVPSGEIVWQWTPPFHPMRVQRYAADFCPQLAALPPMDIAPVVNREPQPYIDQALYDFALSKEVVKLKVAGKKRNLLANGTICQDLMLPGRPLMVLDYGFARAGDPSQVDATGRLKVTFARPGGTPETVYEKSASLTVDGEWSRERTRLDPSWGYAKAKVCIISTAPEMTSDSRDYMGFVVAAPKIASGYRASRRDLPSLTGRRTQKSRDVERTFQERQLEALGYIE
jgi:hypothetical protein